MTDRELALRRTIVRSFAATGRPPDPPIDADPAIDGLVDRHVVVLDGERRISMAHPFAAPGAAATVTSGGRRWWGSCAWDGLGIVAALGLREATVAGNGVTLRIEDGAVLDDAWFHVAVPAAHWWDDIVHT
jgi:hypothetical protein